MRWDTEALAPMAARPSQCLRGALLGKSFMQIAKMWKPAEIRRSSLPLPQRNAVDRTRGAAGTERRKNPGLGIGRRLAECTGVNSLSVGDG